MQTFVHIPAACDSMPGVFRSLFNDADQLNFRVAKMPDFFPILERKLHEVLGLGVPFSSKDTALFVPVAWSDVPRVVAFLIKVLTLLLVF